MNKSQTAAWAAYVSFWLCLGACADRESPVHVEHSGPTSSERPSPAARSEVAVPKVETALVLDRSAYGVKLVATTSGFTLVTAEGLYRKNGETHPVHVPVALNAPFAMMGQQVVHWANKQLVATSLNDGSLERLGALEQMPRDVFASNEHFAWLERSAQGDRIVVADTATIKGVKAALHRVIYRTDHDIVTGTMVQDWVFFVESLPAGQWRLGAASIRNEATASKSGQGVTLGVTRSGRPPAFLLAETDLYYYDGPTRSVRRVTPDLQEETIVAQGVICSPLAVAEQIFCAQVSGVFSVQPPNDGETKSPIREFETHPRGPITAIAASSTQVVWVEDLDGKQLQVRSVRLQ